MSKVTAAGQAVAKSSKTLSKKSTLLGQGAKGKLYGDSLDDTMGTVLSDGFLKSVFQTYATPESTTAAAHVARSPNCLAPRQYEEALTSVGIHRSTAQALVARYTPPLTAEVQPHPVAGVRRDPSAATAAPTLDFDQFSTTCRLHHELFLLFSSKHQTAHIDTLLPVLQKYNLAHPDLPAGGQRGSSSSSSPPPPPDMAAATSAVAALAPTVRAELGVGEDGQVRWATLVKALPSLVSQSMVVRRGPLAAPAELDESIGHSRSRIFLAGAVAGAASRTATAPMDRLRSLQAAGGSSTLGKETGVWAGLRAMYAKGGLRCMWQGNAANCLQVVPESAMLFMFNDMFKKALSSDNPSMAEKFACGSAAGFLSMSAVYPMYVIQNRLLVAPEGHYQSIRHAYSMTYREEGLRGFSRGYTPSSIRIIPYRGIDMSFYSMLRDIFVPKGEDITTVQSLAFGGIASCTSQTVTHPLLVARTRLQCQGFAGRPVMYEGMVDCLKQVYAENGVRSLMGGWAPSMAKNVPSVALQFAFCEKMLQVLEKYDVL